MTETHPEELQELEPLHESDPGGAPAPSGAAEPQYQAMILQRLMSGMAAPFFNLGADKAYYRFFFGGLLITLGALMPFDSDWTHLGYRSFTGALWLIIGLGVMWTMWGAISTGKVRFRWLLLAGIPLLWSLWHLFMNPEPPDFGPGIEGWGDLFALIGKRELSAFGNGLQHYGPGRLFVLLGSLYVELTFILGVFGGVQKNKQIKAGRAAARRR